MKKSKYKQGIYKVVNKEKYMGNKLPYCRSSWERKFCKWCDLREDIVAWGSESIVIPYWNPAKKRMARYYPDFHITVKTNTERKFKYCIVEIKPEKETIPPISKRGKKKTTLLYEQLTFVQNSAKWEAAKEWCKKRGLEFIIITEKQLFPSKFKS